MDSENMFMGYLQKYINYFSGKPISTILLFNIILYVPIILLIPEHILDDFVVFGRIAEHPNIPISLNPDDPYFLFLRPTSYFSFWIDFTLWPLVPITMKFFTLAFHLTLVVMFYKLIAELNKYFKLDIKQGWLLVITILFSTHPDNYRWIIWISNRTELLMIMFYTLSLYHFLRYLNSEKPLGKYLLLSFIFFVLSVTSKQQSMHLPFLIGFLYLVQKPKVTTRIKKGIIILLAAELCIVIGTSLLNIYIYDSNFNIFIDNIWKKPFSSIGLVAIVINPFIGELLYNYFLHNKTMVLIFLPIIVLIAIYLLRKLNWKKLVVLLIGYLVISFPRMFSHATSRINSIHVLILFVLFLFLVFKFKNNIAYLFSAIVITVNLITMGIFIYNEIIYEGIHAKRVSELIKQYDDNTFVLLSRDQLVLQYHYYYSLNEYYGYSKLNIAPIQYWELTYLEYMKIHKKVHIELKNNRLIIDALNNDLIITVNPSEVRNYNFEPNNLFMQVDDSERGYRKIEFDLPDEMKNKKLIYFNGIKWIIIK